MDKEIQELLEAGEAGLRSKLHQIIDAAASGQLDPELLQIATSGLIVETFQRIKRALSLPEVATSLPEVATGSALKDLSASVEGKAGTIENIRMSLSLTQNYGRSEGLKPIEVSEAVLNVAAYFIDHFQEVPIRKGLVMLVLLAENFGTQQMVTPDAFEDRAGYSKDNARKCIGPLRNQMEHVKEGAYKIVGARGIGWKIVSTNR